MSLAQGNNTPTRPRIEPGSPDPESDALTTRPVRPLRHYVLKFVYMIRTTKCNTEKNQGAEIYFCLLFLFSFFLSLTLI